MITWDEPKRRDNLRKHGIDLVECEVIFDAPLATTEDDRKAYGEQRLQSLGLFYGVVVFLVQRQSSIDGLMRFKFYNGLSTVQPANRRLMDH
jgi:hypothetical protein